MSHALFIKWTDLDIPDQAVRILSGSAGSLLTENALLLDCKASG